MNMYVMLMLMLWDVNACLTPRGVTNGYAGSGRYGASEKDEPTRKAKWSSGAALHGYLYEMV
jgi:hypothetical protein